MDKKGLVEQKQYKSWLTEIKQHLHSVQMKAMITVNRELLRFYWQLATDIVSKQERSHWGSGFIKQLSADLKLEFPQIKGFSERNIQYMRKWYLFYRKGDTKTPQAVAQLEENGILDLITQIPWGHNREIISKCGCVEEAIFYIRGTIKNNWSRNVLLMQIDSSLHLRKGKSVNNFQTTLPQAQSDLAQQTLKDPYVFDFLTLSKSFKEREMELGLIIHLEKFLLELGQGFAFVGRQYALSVSDQDFYLDLLFYHLELRCFVIIDLKTGAFKPEYVGKMNFYCAVVDDRLKKEHDKPTIGLILCQDKNKVIAEYALRGQQTPIGVSEFEFSKALPKNFTSALPSIEEIEKKLSSNEVIQG